MKAIKFLECATKREKVRSFRCSGCGQLIEHTYDANNLSTVINESSCSYFECCKCHKTTPMPAIDIEKVIICVTKGHEPPYQSWLTIVSHPVFLGGTLQSAIRAICDVGGIDYENDDYTISCLIDER